MDDLKVVVSWECARKHIHDASGINNPEDYKWYFEKGCYYPFPINGRWVEYPEYKQEKILTNY